MQIFLSIFVLFVSLAVGSSYTGAAEKEKENKDAIPNSVMDISKENTYPNPTQDLPYLQPSELSKELLETTDVPVENPDLIKLMNESAISTTPLAIGYKATIYLGHWPLSYESGETNTNWEYKQANVNKYDNREGTTPYKIHYKQEAEMNIQGGLTMKVPNSEDVKKMMLLKAMEKTNLPLAFNTMVGQGTKKDQVYNIMPKKLGYLYAYAPAVNEKGKITYGEVYLELRGSKKQLVIKNVTRQGIGAWIPVQDRLSFKFYTTDLPK
ncbi:YfkD family protein [Bacillus tianshenii]|nr:YfkD family protein [Bacillus tianshenii]